MKVTQIVCSALVVGVITTAAHAVSQDPLQQFNLASQAYRNGRFDTALQEFEGFIGYFSKHRLAPQARLALGEIKFNLKKYPEAADQYAAVFKKYGDTYEAQSALLRFGQCEFNMKKYLSSIDYFKRVKKDGTKVLRAEAILNEALALMALKDHEKAEAMLVDMLQSYPKYKSNPAAVVPLGLLYMDRNRLQDALELFELLPEDLGAQFYRGVALKKLGQTIAASQLFKDVAETDPAGYWADKAQLQMAEAYYQVNELNLAYDAYRKVFDKYVSSPLRPYALHRMACIHFQLGRFQEAGLKWEQLVRTFEDDVNLPNGIYMLGEMALRQGEYGKAISFFSQIADTHELRMDAQFKIIWCLAEQKQDEAAVARADQFLKDYPWGELAAKTHVLKGIGLQRMKKFREANQEYQVVIDQFGNSIHSEKALYLMATSLFENNQLAEIVTSLNSTLKLAPVSPTRWQAETYLWVAEAYYGLNQYDASARTYQLIVDNYKDTPKLAYAMLGVAASKAKVGEYDEASLAFEKSRVMAESSKSKDVERSVLMDNAQVLFTQKKYDKAMGYFDEYANRYPDDSLVPQALFQSAVCHYRLEYYTEAIKRWDRVARVYPTHELAPKALFEIGKTLFGLGSYAEAADRFQFLLEKYPGFDQAKEARIHIAQAYYNQGRYDLATTKLQEFINNYPKDPKSKDVLELLQMAQYRQGKGKVALAELTEKYPKSKLTADIYWQLGAEAFNEKQYKQSLEYFQKLVGEFPEAEQVSQAYYYMAEAHFNLEEYPKAVTAYKNYILNFPKSPNRVQTLFRLGVSHFQSKNFNEAVIAFNDALEAEPTGGLARDAMMNIAVCYKKLDQPNQAMGAYENFLIRFPADPQRNKVLLQMGELNMDLKEYEAAVKNLSKIPDDAAESFEAYVALGKVYRLLKLPTKELDAFEKLRAKSPKDNETRLSGLVTLAEIYQENGKIDSAIAVYEDIAKNSTNPEWKQAALDRAKTLREETK
ncbi:MAG: tetratricopeptide repeat protein [Elusimicrobia bacterium]|nr:tetratricopeptide repeat protein [Candidatus Obscuribacterium magneticum]